jgi:hypothetical protein
VTIVDLRLEEEELALRSLQKSTIHNLHSSINVSSAAGRINRVAFHRAKIHRCDSGLPNLAFYESFTRQSY